MRGALLSTAVVALSLGLVRGGASGDASGNISARLRATGHAEDNPGLRKLQDEFVKEQHQHEARFGRRVSAEEIKALVAHRLEAHPAHQTAKENFQRIKLQRKARFDSMLQEGEKAAIASGHLLQGFIYGKEAVQEQEIRMEQANRVLLQQGAR